MRLILMKLSIDNFWQILASSVFLSFWKFETDDVMAAIFFFVHTHGRNFDLIFFKIAGKIGTFLLFAIENQPNRLLTSANMADLVSEK